jgi:hypothetical protein
MIINSFVFLLTSLTALTQATPIAAPEKAPDALPEPATSPNLATRDTGVWLDVYTSGNCKTGWSPQPTSGWLWAGQCKNLESGTFGARLGNNHNEWPWCKLKFWEKRDCHGHATATYVVDDRVKGIAGFAGDYQCIAVAYKDGEFYLKEGAGSVELLCDKWYY